MAGETPKATAVSSTLNPPKKRSSITFDFTLVDFGESFQRIIESDDVGRLFGTNADDFVDRHLLDPATALGAAMLSRMIDQDLPHEVGCYPEEVGPAFPIRHALRHQAQICLVHQSRRLNVAADLSFRRYRSASRRSSL